MQTKKLSKHPTRGIKGHTLTKFCNDLVLQVFKRYSFNYYNNNAYVYV